MALLYDYIDLFDRHAKRTGSVNWIKCMTENELDEIGRTLLHWQNQSESQPQSPTFSKLCGGLDMARVW